MSQDILDIKDKGQIQGCLCLEDHILIDLQIILHLGQHLLIQVPGIFHTDGGELTALLDHLFHMLAVAQLLVIALIRIDIRVPGHPDQGLADNVITVKYTGQEMQDQLLGQHIIPAGTGDLDQPPEHPVIAGNDTDPCLYILCLGILGAENRHRTDLIILDEGERLLLRHDDGRKQRHDLLFEVGLQISSLPFIQFGEIDQMDILLLHPSHKIGVGHILPFAQLLHPFPDGLQLLLHGHSGLVLPGPVLQQHLIMDRPHTDHEEFIQIGLVDGNKAQPFTEGSTLILGLLQHSLIESEPGQLPVLVDRLQWFNMFVIFLIAHNLLLLVRVPVYLTFKYS